MRRTSAILAAGLVVLIANPAAAAPAPDAPRSRDRGLPVVAALADRDGDRMADGLQHRLVTHPDAGRVAVIIRFEQEGSAADVQRAVGPLTVHREFSVIPGFAASVTPRQARAIARLDGVARVDEDFTVSVTMDTVRDDFGITAARQQLSVDGAGVEICVVDTGVDATHEQLDSKTIAFYDAIGGQTAPYDDQGHGTHVAAIAAGDGTGGASAASYAGVAPAADLSVAKVLDASGSGTASQVVAGVDWCAGRPGVRIISLSLGSATASDGNDPISAAVDAAVAAGKVAVVAAGNSGDTPGTVGSPGAARGALTVGAVAGWSGGPGLHLAPFSSRGPTTDGRTKPDVAAPGVAITSAQAGQRTGYVSFSGTSMATPFTSGTVALMLQRDPALTPSLVASRIAATARDRGVAGHDNDWGHGVLDGLAALAAADSTPASAAFPTSETVVGTVATGSVSRHEVSVTDTSMPLSATMLVDGELTCALFAFFCWAYEWSPDLELRLIAPNGTQLAASECPAYGNCAGVGHQETITVNPTVTGTYVLEVYPFDGSPNNGTGGPFVLDVSHGPLLQGLAPGDPVGGDDPGTDPPPEPPADDPVTHLTSGERAVLGDVDGSHVATHVPDEAVQTITETQGGKGRNRYSGMEHRWIFEVADPGAWTLQMQAQTAGFSGGDGVTLAYSLNGKKWTKLGALGTEPYPLDGFTSGTLQVRVTDVDRTSGVQSNGTLAVDYLAITETTAQP